MTQTRLPFETLRGRTIAVLLRVESDVLALVHDPDGGEVLSAEARDKLRLAASLISEVRV